MSRKALKWIGTAALAPIVLFAVLAILIYLPPVQNWAVQQTVAIVSEKTGMDISIGHINLEFPLDLGIDDFRALRQNDSLPQLKDTIADVRKLTVDVKLRPLLSKRVVIEQLLLSEAKINTNGFISDLRIKGTVGQLWLASKGIDLDKESVEVNGARLSDAWVDIALSDTAAVDTTESDVKWRIVADSLTITHTDIAIHLPDDTLDVKGHLGRVVARETDIDLGEGIYRIASLDWHDGTLNYDNKWEPETAGIDYNHLALSGIRLGVDSIDYSPGGLALFVRQTAMKEKCGLEITELTGGIRLDSAFNCIQLPGATLRTPDSDIYAEADIDLNAFEPDPTLLPKEAGASSGQMKLRLNAQLGKQDLAKIIGELPNKFIEHYPNHPLSVKGAVNGSIRQLAVTALDINLPTALHATVSGTAGNLTDLNKLRANMKIALQGQDLNFVSALMPDAGIRIPKGISLNGTVEANGTAYAANLTAQEDKSSIALDGRVRIPLTKKGDYYMEGMSYEGDMEISELNIQHFLPEDSIADLSASVSFEGYGTDFLSDKSRLTADAVIDHLQYGEQKLDSITATVRLEDGKGQADLTGHNNLFDGNLSIEALLSTERIHGTIGAELDKADIYQMRLTDNPLVIGLSGSIDIDSDLKKSHKLSGLIDDIYIKGPRNTFRPEKVGVLVKTNPDTTYVRAQSGDLIIKVDADGDYETVANQLTTLTDSIMAQLDQKVIDQPAIKQLLPKLKVHLESKRGNPLANLLKTNDIEFKELLLDLDISAETGINGAGHVYSMILDSTRIDTIRLSLIQKGERLTYQSQIRNNKKNPQFVFNALLDGHIHEHGALAGLRYYDKQNKLGIRLGVTAEMESEGLRFRLMPERPTLAYKEFNLNKDNYIFIGNHQKIEAKVDLVADDNAGIKLYTENQDSTMLQDLTLSLNRLDLSQLTSVVPYMPHITGRLTGDYHIVQDQDKNFSVASDMSIANLTYESSQIGNLSTEFVYLMNESDTHAVEARIMLEEKEVGLLSGTYQSEGEGYINADFTMNHFPLSIANGFVTDQIVGLEGYGEGTLSIKGSTSHSDIDGEVYVDSASLVSIPYGIKMRLDNDPIRIVDSKLLLENFGLYAYNEEPLNIMGNVDFTDFGNITMDMRMRARNMLLINAKQQANSVAFGKAFVNFFARMQGPIEMLRMRGRLDVLASTDMTYILLDSPLSTDNRLNELVQFTDFSDSTQTVVTHPTPEGLDVDLSINVSNGAHIVCDLNVDQSNYVDLLGGGDLRLKYNTEGINLLGRYTLTSGEMKYSLPVIPLKTFSIKDGSYVEFTGDPFNPKLDITATEQVKATVNDEGGQPRSVLFECGVIITKTLNDMGVEFTISAPEDNSINGTLTTMSKEERGKLAVGMLTTGMYLADGSTGKFSMNSALSSFLQSEINNIAGSALKTLDLSLNIDNTTDATGNTRTDYSFKFSKRFFDNRLKVQIGGKVSSGETNYQGEKQSFFDNVSMEYRLNADATKYVKLFYSQNVYDWLDGYTSEYGGGFIWRRKLDKFWDIFRLWKKEEQRMPGPRRPATTPVQTDSVKVNRQQEK